MRNIQKRLLFTACLVFVFRGDVGFGSEGVTPEIFIGYPWEI